LELPHDSSSLKSSVYFAIRGKIALYYFVVLDTILPLNWPLFCLGWKIDTISLISECSCTLCPNVENFYPNNGQFFRVWDATTSPASSCCTLMPRTVSRGRSLNVCELRSWSMRWVSQLSECCRGSKCSVLCFWSVNSSKKDCTTLSMDKMLDASAKCRYVTIKFVIWAPGSLTRRVNIKKHTNVLFSRPLSFTQVDEFSPGSCLAHSSCLAQFAGMTLLDYLVYQYLLLKYLYLFKVNKLCLRQINHLNSIRLNFHLDIQWTLNVSFSKRAENAYTEQAKDILC